MIKSPYQARVLYLPMHNQALADNKTMRYPSYFATKTYAQYLAMDISVALFPFNI